MRAALHRQHMISAIKIQSCLRKHLIYRIYRIELSFRSQQRALYRFRWRLPLAALASKDCFLSSPYSWIDEKVEFDGLLYNQDAFGDDISNMIRQEGSFGCVLSKAALAGDIFDSIEEQVE